MHPMVRRLMPCLAALVTATTGLVAQEPDSTQAAELTYAVGADLSFLKSAEDRGVQFKDNGVVRPGLDIFRDHGYDWIRLRLFHTPTELPNDLEYTIALAQEAKARGFKFLLDYHYADGWADPGKQPTLEAQLIDLADEIAYNNHDIDDGLKAGYLDMEALMAVDLWAETYTRVVKKHPSLPA